MNQLPGNISKLDELKSKIEAARTNQQVLELELELAAIELASEQLESEVHDRRSALLDTAADVETKRKMIEVRTELEPEIRSLASETATEMAKDQANRTISAMKKAKQIALETHVEADVSVATLGKRKSVMFNRVQQALNSTPDLVPQMRLAQSDQVESVTTIDA